MELRHVADFIALAEQRSFSKAAESRHVTQPAFSRRIKTLEEDLGVKLVDRETTPVTLTPAGERFLRHAQSLVGLADNVAADMQALATNMPRALHIQMSNSLSNAFFPLWYKEMLRRVRGLTFRLSHQRSRLSLDDLRSGMADFAVQLEVKGIKRPYDYSNTLGQVIGQDRLLFVKAAHAQKDQTSLIMHRANSYMTPCVCHALGDERMKRMKIVFESPSSEFTRSMVMAGFGAGLLQESLIADDLKDGFLIPALPDVKPLKADIIMLRGQRPLSAKAESLWEKSRLD